MTLDANKIGLTGEFYVAYDISKQGYNLSFATEAFPYDILIELNNKIYRVQVKTLTQRADSRKKSLKSYRFRLQKRENKSRIAYNTTDCDVFALFASDIEKVAYFHISELTKQDNTLSTRVTIRDIDPKSDKQRKNIKYFKDYNKIERLESYLSNYKQ